MAKIPPRKQVRPRAMTTKSSSSEPSTASSSSSEDSSSARSQYSQTSTDSDHGKHEMMQTRAPIRSSIQQSTDWRKYHRRNPKKPPIGSNKKTNEHTPVSRVPASKASRPFQASPGEPSHGGASVSRSEGISIDVYNGREAVCETQSAVDELSDIFADASSKAKGVLRREIDTERQARQEAERLAKTEKERHQRANSELKAKLEACESKNEELSKKLEENAETINKLQEELNTREEEKKNAVDKLSHSQGISESLTKELVLSSENVQDQGRSLAEKEAENSELRSRTEDQERLLAEKEDENSRLRSEIENQKRSLAEKEAKDTELRSETERANQERREADKSFDKVLKDWRALFKENQAISTTQEALNNAKEKVQQLKQEKESQETATAKLRQDLGNVYDARQDDFQKITTLESESQRLHERNQNLTRDNESFQLNICLLYLMLQYAGRLLIDEKARSTQLRTEAQVLCTIFDEVAERQTELTTANKSLQVINSKYQDRIRALQTRLIRLEMRFSKSKKKRSRANHLPSERRGSWEWTQKEDHERSKGPKHLAWMRKGLFERALAQIENGYVREINLCRGRRHKKTTCQ